MAVEGVSAALFRVLKEMTLTEPVPTMIQKTYKVKFGQVLCSAQIVAFFLSYILRGMQIQEQSEMPSTKYEKCTA